jgi:hypothetical protein
MSPDLDGEALLYARQVLRRHALSQLRSLATYDQHNGADTDHRRAIEAKHAAAVRADEVIASWFPEQTPPPGPCEGSTPSARTRPGTAGGRDPEVRS